MIRLTCLILFATIYETGLGALNQIELAAVRDGLVLRDRLVCLTFTQNVTVNNLVY